MEIFIDTAKLSEINEARSWGIVDRVTTNPTLLRVRKITAEKLNRCLRNSATNEISSLYLDVRKINDALENDGIGSGAELVKKIVEILRNYDLKTKVIAASMRNPRQVRSSRSWSRYRDHTFDVLQAMLRHPKTEGGVKKFYADATQVKYGELFCGGRQRRIIERAKK